ncbi:hypothetical protein BSP38_044 [Bacillus phage BSP38]|uniref:3'-5' exoribonuclease Rv2179c-like domain-containing protein n=1 Tax=Bacillus phage BSP38 TaxID=2283013 RepID=A0A345MJQ4_BPBSP|nr:Rnase H [Bacillus phage BSP38]AXH71086.1 hypothetical protein BSP38_044 [Bacillus phage BSP38]
MTKVFFDFEFTGLQKGTTPISLGMAADNGKTLYCEFTDYDKSQVDDWIKKNVLDNLILNWTFGNTFSHEVGDASIARGSSDFLSKVIRGWVAQFDKVEFWGDTLYYDAILLNDLLGGALNLPDNVCMYYGDIATLFKIHGIDPDISRESFIDTPIEGARHNALYDARVIEACYDKLYRNRDKYPLVF